MNLTRSEFAKVLGEFCMFTFPRRVGSPYQVTVGNPTGFFSWWEQKTNSGQPLFIAHNGLVPPAEGHKLDVNKYYFQSAFGDFDVDTGCTGDEVWEEVFRVESFFRSENLKHGWKMSGNLINNAAAFHSHVMFKPAIMSRDKLHKYEAALWRGLTHKLNLKCINLGCAEPARLTRIPFSLYSQKGADGQYYAQTNYCVPVPCDVLWNGNLNDVKEISRKPRLFPSYLHGDLMPTIEEFVEKMEWEAYGPDAHELVPMPESLPTGAMADLFKLLEPTRLCMQILPFESNPRHYARFGAAAVLVQLGLGLDECIAYFDKINEEAGWLDGGNRDERVKQVTQIYNRKYAVPSCNKLRANGCCLGERCGRFKTMFPGG